MGYAHADRILIRLAEEIMIVVMDYGVGNVKSVTNAVKYIGCDVKVSCKLEDINNADGIILPGVGACGERLKDIRTS